MKPFLAAIALLALTATPSQARDYPWCSRTSASFYHPSCDFTSYPQCMATVSGQRGDCVRNPWLIFEQQEKKRTKPKRNRHRR